MVAASTAVGSARRADTAAPITLPSFAAEEGLEDEITKMEKKEKKLSCLLEDGVSHLSSMRASMAKFIWRSIKARLAWRATPSCSFDDKTVEGYGVHALERIKGYAN